MQKRKRSKGGFNCAAGRCEVKSLMHFYHFWRFLWDPSVEFCNEILHVFFQSIDLDGHAPPKQARGPQNLTCSKYPAKEEEAIQNLKSAPMKLMAGCKEYHEYHECRNL